MQHLKRFLVLLGACALTTLVLTLFLDRRLPAFINLGSYVGAFCLLLGAWRLMNGSNVAIEQAHMHQRVESMHAAMQARAPIHKQIVPIFLAPGALFFAGLSWLVLLQVIRYKWGIVLE